MRPTINIQIEATISSGSGMRLLQTLEDHDDVNVVHANFDVDAELRTREGRRTAR